MLLGAVARAAQEADSQHQRQLERAERRFADVQLARDAAFDALLADYHACQAWLTEDASAPPEIPLTVRRSLQARGVPVETWPAEGRRLAESMPFHALWNEDLYRRSHAARDYREAQGDLERAFHTVEKLRHPERYQRGFEDTPSGMTLIPGGTYALTAATGYLLGHPDLQQPREVRIAAFYLDRKEVSCAEYLRFLLSLPSALREEHLPDAWLCSDEGGPEFPLGWAALPVCGVPWSSAASYAEWSGKRLPSEDEWQAAAAGFSARVFPIGDRFDATQVNCRAHGAGAPLADSDLAGDHTPQGVVCLTGNVREWCADLFEEAAGQDRAERVDEAGPTTLAAARGGSYLDATEACRSDFRWLFPARGGGLPNLGFRCALSVR